MAGTLADLGAAELQNIVFGVTAKPTLITFKLFTNDFTPSDTSTVGSFTEATGGGYTAKTLQLNVAYIASVAITSSSAANPTNILATAHGLTSADTVTIANHSGSVTDINGTHVVTVTDANNFTIPVNLTGGGGTGGTLSRGMNQSSVGGIEQMASNAIPFVFTGVLTTNPTIFGAFFLLGSVLLGGEKFGTSITPNTAGDKVNVPYIHKTSKGTAT